MYIYSILSTKFGDVHDAAVESGGQFVVLVATFIVAFDQHGQLVGRAVQITRERFEAADQSEQLVVKLPTVRGHRSDRPPVVQIANVVRQTEHAGLDDRQRCPCASPARPRRKYSIAFAGRILRTATTDILLKKKCKNFDLFFFFFFNFCLENPKTHRLFRVNIKIELIGTFFRAHRPTKRLRRIRLIEDPSVIFLRPSD